MRSSRIIHVEKFGAKGISYGTHASHTPNRSKKKTRRRPVRNYRVHWIDVSKWTPTMWYPPTWGWSSLEDFDNPLEIIFHANH